MGHLTARQFADLLSAAPSPVPVPPDPPGRSRRFLMLAAGLVLVGVLLIALGRVFVGGDDRPPIFPTTTAVTDTVALPSSSTTTTVDVQVGATTTVPLTDVPVTATRSVDPFGGNEENDERLGNMIDGDPSTVWRTERYRDPLQLLKPGVGVAFEVDATVREIIVVGLEAGTVYEIGWTDDLPEPGEWEVAVRGIAGVGTTRHQLPARPPGTWVLWFTDLPVISPEDRSTEVAEVRFLR